MSSSRLLTYREGDNSEEEMARQRERTVKLTRFNEVLQLLKEKDSKYPSGGQMKIFPEGGKLTQQKASQILHDGTAHGKLLTPKQRKYFGARAGGEPVKSRK